MIYTTCVMAYSTFAYGRPKHVKTLIAVGLIALALWISIYYHMSQNPVFHQVAYAILTCAVVFRGMYVMEWHLRPALRERNPAEGDAIMQKMWEMAITGMPATQVTIKNAPFANGQSTGIALFLIGFAIWNADNIFCKYLLSARHTLLLPWAALLEGHGWWHIFTSLGAYYFIIWRVWLEICLEGKERELMLYWPSPYTSVPRVFPRTDALAGASRNGHANGNGHKASKSSKKTI